MGIEWRVAKVRELHGPAPPRCFAEEGVIESYPGAPKSIEHFWARAVDGPDAQILAVLVELVDGAAVCPGQQHCLRDDRGEHLSEVQAGAHGFAHCAESLELVHFVPEFAGAALQRPHEINGTNGESRLRREGREDCRCALAKRIHLRFATPRAPRQLRRRAASGHPSSVR